MLAKDPALRLCAERTPMGVAAAVTLVARSFRAAQGRGTEGMYPHFWAARDFPPTV